MFKQAGYAGVYQKRSGPRGQTFVPTLRPTKRNGCVLALDKSALAQPAAERRDQVR